MSYAFMRAWKRGRKTRLAGLLGGPLICLLFILIITGTGHNEAFSADSTLAGQILGLLVVLFAFFSQAFIVLPAWRDREKLFQLTSSEERKIVLGLMAYLVFYAFLSLLASFLIVLMAKYLEYGKEAWILIFRQFKGQESFAIVSAFVIQLIFAISLIFFSQFLYFLIRQKMGKGRGSFSIVSIIINALTFLLFWQLGRFINDFLFRYLPYLIKADQMALISGFSKGDLYLSRFIWTIVESASMGFWKGWSLTSLIFITFLIIFNISASITIAEDKLDW